MRVVIPKKPSKVTLDGFIGFNEHRDDLMLVTSHLANCDPADMRYLITRYHGIMTHIAGHLSGKGYEAIASIPDPINEAYDAIGQFGRICKQTLDICNQLYYNPSEPKKYIKHFYHYASPPKSIFSKKVRYHLFDFGKTTVNMHKYFLTHWSQFVQESIEGLVNFNYSSLKKLIALIAWPENELYRIAGKVNHIEEKCYEVWTEKVAEREITFGSLPVTTAFKIMDHFFFSSPKYVKTIQIYMTPKVALKPNKNESITESTVLTPR